MADKTKFLSYAGLEKLWSLIGGKFATKADALKSVEMTADANGVNVAYTKVNGDSSTAALPVANESQAGIITAATFNKIEAVAGNIESAVTVKDVKIGDASILHDKVASFALEYEVDATKNEAYIALVDAGVAKGTEGRALSRIDVSALVKTGLLAGVDLVVSRSVQAAGTFIKMTFNTVNGTQDTYINVTDLIDLYTAGDGIVVADTDVNGDNGAPAARTISLKAAADGVLGGIKLGYTAAAGVEKTYAVQVDENGKAFVNVPWVDVAAGITGDEYISATGELKDGEGAFVINATDKLKNAVTAATTAIQTAEGETGDAALVTASAASNKITVGTTDKLKNAVAKAETALQTVTDSSTLLDITTSGSTVTIADSTKLTEAVAKAETAMQSVNVLGTTLKDGDALSVDAAKTALGLKGAAYADVATAIDNADNAAKVATAGQVATYVGGINTTLTEAVNKLDQDLKNAKTALETKDNELAGRLATVEGRVGAPATADNAATGLFATIEENEKVTAEALNDLDARVKANADAIASNDSAQKAYVDNAINALDATFAAEVDAEAKPMFLTGLTQVDGKITAVTKAALSVNDLTDFVALTDTEIEGICK